MGHPHRSFGLFDPLSDLKGEECLSFPVTESPGKLTGSILPTVCSFREKIAHGALARLDWVYTGIRFG